MIVLVLPGAASSPCPLEAEPPRAKASETPWESRAASYSKTNRGIRQLPSSLLSFSTSLSSTSFTRLSSSSQSRENGATLSSCGCRTSLGGTQRWRKTLHDSSTAGVTLHLLATTPWFSTWPFTFSPLHSFPQTWWNWISARSKILRRITDNWNYGVEQKLNIEIWDKRNCLTEKYVTLERHGGPDKGWYDRKEKNWSRFQIIEILDRGDDTNRALHPP